MRLRDILLVSDRKFAALLEPGLFAADAVHRWPAMAHVPVVVTRSRREEGGYYFSGRPERPLRIEISRFAARPELTLLHEAGHMLDQFVLNPIKRDYASEHDAAFEELRAAWERSGTVRNLARMLQKRLRWQTPQDRRLLQYALQYHELWARTYVQWIVRRSDRVQLGEAFEGLRGEQYLLAGVPCDLHWEDADFADIMVCVDSLMRQARLI